MCQKLIFSFNLEQNVAYFCPWFLPPKFIIHPSPPFSFIMLKICFVLKLSGRFAWVAWLWSRQYVLLRLPDFRKMSKLLNLIACAAAYQKGASLFSINRVFTLIWSNELMKGNDTLKFCVCLGAWDGNEFNLSWLGVSPLLFPRREEGRHPF